MINDLSQLYTVKEVDDFIDHEICRDCPEIRTRAEGGRWTVEERAANSKLDAVCKALERRAELENVPV